jgi:DNA mismatch repair protein MSH5
LDALQIFKHELHPSVIKGRGRAKEGFSLYGILDRTVSTCGRTLMREWLLKPSKNLQVITERHKSIEALLKPECTSFVGEVSTRIRRVRDAPKIMFRIRTVTNSLSDWKALFHSVMEYRCVCAAVLYYMYLAITSPMNITL